MLCYEIEVCDDSTRAWRLSETDEVVDRDGTLVLELPICRRRKPVEGMVNGLPVAGGTHVLKKGDLMWFSSGKNVETERFVCHAPVAQESGVGHKCLFTGLSITGEARRCPNCQGLVAEEVARDIEECPRCKCHLQSGSPPFPPEELL